MPNNNQYSLEKTTIDRDLQTPTLKASRCITEKGYAEVLPGWDEKNGRSASRKLAQFLGAKEESRTFSGWS